MPKTSVFTVSICAPKGHKAKPVVSIFCNWLMPIHYLHCGDIYSFSRNLCQLFLKNSNCYVSMPDSSGAGSFLIGSVSKKRCGTGSFFTPQYSSLGHMDK